MNRGVIYSCSGDRFCPPQCCFPTCCAFLCIISPPGTPTRRKATFRIIPRVNYASNEARHLSCDSLVFLGGMTFNGRGTRRSRWCINEADERVREGDSCVFAHSVKLTRDEAVAVRAVVVSMGTKTKAPRPETHSRPVKMHPSAGRVLVLLPPPAT